MASAHYLKFFQVFFDPNDVFLYIYFIVIILQEGTYIALVTNSIVRNYRNV